MRRLLEKQAKNIFLKTLGELRHGFLELVCPDATYAFGEPTSPLRAMAVIHDETFFQRALVGADVGLGESYTDGDWTTPDLVTLVRVMVRNLRTIDSRNRVASAIRGFASRVKHRLADNSITGSRKNIRAHYDIGNDFYRLFLDAQMNYSSGYFTQPGEPLGQAQERKLDMICQKLRIEPGDRVLEIGCGWGGFALHAAKRYGAHVTGVTISEAQYKFAVERAASANLGEGRVSLLLEDYRKVRGRFDKIVSIEMFEAVGLDHYDAFFGACDRLLTSNGSMLLQTITLPDQRFAGYRKRVDWIQRYIFPGSELASIAEIHKSLSRVTELFPVHSENFGMHYAETLSQWRERFFQNLERVRQLGFDERFRRMWDFYLGWCEGAFRERYVNVAQLLFAKNATQDAIMGDLAARTEQTTPASSC